MTKITIERETLRQLFNEMETVDYEFDPPERVLVMMDELRAALAQPPMVDDMQDIPLPEPTGYGPLGPFYNTMRLRAYGDAREAAARERVMAELRAGVAG